MSTLTSDPKFARGQVLGILWKAYDADNGDGTKVIGQRVTFLDESPITKLKLSNRTVDCIAVKNVSGGTLAPGAIVKFRANNGTTDAGDAGLSQVDGVAASTDTLYGVVDEYLTASVPDQEVFWLVVSGPSVVKKVTGAISANAALTISSATAGSAAAGTSPLLGYAIKAAVSGDTTVRVQVSSPVRG
jgi:hypothetical protein